MLKVWEHDGFINITLPNTIDIDWQAMEVVLGPKDSDADLPVKVMSAFREYHEQLEKKIIQEDLAEIVPEAVRYIQWLEDLARHLTDTGKNTGAILKGRRPKWLPTLIWKRKE